MSEERAPLTAVDLPEEGDVSYWDSRGQVLIRKQGRSSWTVRRTSPSPAAALGTLYRDRRRWLVISPQRTTRTFDDWRDAISSMR